MISIQRAETPDDLDAVRALIRGPPTGCLVLARLDGEPVGCEHDRCALRIASPSLQVRSGEFSHALGRARELT
jgi:hypothetical protein